MFKLWYLLHNFFLLVEFSLRAALIKAVNRDPITQRRKLAHNTHRTAKKYLKQHKKFKITSPKPEIWIK